MLCTLWHVKNKKVNLFYTHKRLQNFLQLTPQSKYNSFCNSLAILECELSFSTLIGLAIFNQQISSQRAVASECWVELWEYYLGGAC